ncbi:sporulation-delaying protein SdpB family protein [Amycolatopsis lurida]|uniref:sporulation-delaying protein SdpB family protein n=1 Tax=Amycolatopsis lurida TaxID=31959 RepID=UPI0036615EC0
MRPLIGLRRRLTLAIGDHEHRRFSFALGRSLLASAQLSVLLFNPDTTLFVTSPELPQGMRCGGARAASLWCLTAEIGIDPLFARLVAMATLLVVVSGYRPRWTCVPHWYVNFSLAACLPLANGGDRAAEVGAMLLIPICLGDDRKWQWRAPRAPLSEQWRGSAYAAHWCLRAQVAVIYLTAATLKVMDPAWSQGRAMRLVAFDAQYGFPLPIRSLLEPMLTSGWLVALATWAVIAVQYFMAVAILGTDKWRKSAVMLGLALHLAIGLLLGLPSFALAMIALLLCAGSSSRLAVVPEVSAVPREESKC